MTRTAMLPTYRSEPTSEMGGAKRQKPRKKGQKKKGERREGRTTPGLHYIKQKTKERPQRARRQQYSKSMPAISLVRSATACAALSPRSPLRVVDSSARVCVDAPRDAVQPRRGKSLSVKPRCAKLLRCSEIPDTPCAERSTEQSHCAIRSCQQTCLVCVRLLLFT